MLYLDESVFSFQVISEIYCSVARMVRSVTSVNSGVIAAMETPVTRRPDGVGQAVLKASGGPDVS